MMNKLSAILIFFNFLHLLVNGYDLEIKSQAQHQQYLHVQKTLPEPQSQPEAPLPVGQHPKRHHNKNPQSRKGLHSQHRPLPTQPQPQPGHQPGPLPNPTQPLPRKGLKHQRLPTQPLPRKGPEPQPLPTHPLHHKGQTQPQLPIQGNSLRDMYNAISSSKPQAYLDAHNEFRAKMGVPPLQWDKKLEDYAFAYGSKRAADCRLQHSHGPYGENLYWELYEESSPEQIVKSLTDEQQNYDLSKGECKCHQERGKCMCGHFTAIIWKSTERVGCAEVKCEAEQGKLVVCSYDPPGNVIGQDPLHTQ